MDDLEKITIKALNERILQKETQQRERKKFQREEKRKRKERKKIISDIAKLELWKPQFPLALPLDQATVQEYTTLYNQFDATLRPLGRYLEPIVTTIAVTSLLAVVTAPLFASPTLFLGGGGISVIAAYCLEEGSNLALQKRVRDDYDYFHTILPLTTRFQELSSILYSEISTHEYTSFPQKTAQKLRPIIPRLLKGLDHNRTAVTHFENHYESYQKLTSNYLQ